MDQSQQTQQPFNASQVQQQLGGMLAAQAPQMMGQQMMPQQQMQQAPQMMPMQGMQMMGQPMMPMQGMMAGPVPNPVGVSIRVEDPSGAGAYVQFTYGPEYANPQALLMLVNGLMASGLVRPRQQNGNGGGRGSWNNGGGGWSNNGGNGGNNWGGGGGRSWGRRY